MPFKSSERRREYQRAYGKRHPGDRHLSRVARADEAARYIAVDGEGLGDLYAYLADSTGRSLGPRRDGLSTMACLDFLVDLGLRPEPSIVVGFSLGYDIENVLADLKERTFERLDDPSVWTRWGDFLLKYWPRKRFQVKRISDGAYIRIDDVFSFFNTGFERVVSDWLGKDAASPLLAEGKRTRGTWTWDDYESGFVQRYNAEELRLLVGVMRRFNAAKHSVGIRTADHYSPAALSRAKLQEWGVRPYITDLPPGVREAAYAAFFGGRIECAAYGVHRGAVYNYDLNSAYPRFTSVLPDLAHGRWVRERKQDVPRWGEVVLYHLRWHFKAKRRFYPFPWRESNGAVYFPDKGTGWVWSPEFESAFRSGAFGSAGSVTILDAWRFVSEPERGLEPVRPFARIIDLYRQRKEYANLPEEKVIKLVLSAIYGKLAQRTSASRRQPTYHQIAYAGLITSRVRALLYEVVRTAEESIISIATDGVYSTEPLTLPPNLVGDYLGQFKGKRYEEMVSLQSGVYRLRDVDGWHSFGRGFGERDLPWDRIVAGWHARQREIAYELRKPRFVGHRLAFQTDPSTWRKWIPVTKKISLGAVGKRTDVAVCREVDRSHELAWTAPDSLGLTINSESAPNLPNFEGRETERDRKPVDERRDLPLGEGTCEDLNDPLGEDGPEPDPVAEHDVPVRPPGLRSER
jgi:hypothetical protein